jgi:hypothetical protein
MSDPNNSDNPSGGLDDTRSSSFRQNLSKFEYDLYHEEENIVSKIIRVKRVGTPARGERWKIFEDTKLIFVLDGTKVSKKEREFLRGIEGITFLIAQAKIGIKSLHGLRTELKQKLKSKVK